MSLLRRTATSLALVALGIAPALGATVSVPLQQLTDAPELTLRCISDRQSLQVPLPERWSLRRAVLTLRYSVSNNVARDSSQLVIRVNDSVVAQMRLNPQAPDAPIDVPIPGELLRPGYNQVSFESVQHSTVNSRAQCEDYCSADLWTRIDLKQSSFKFDFDYAAVPMDLSKLSTFVFDPRITPQGSVHIVTEDLSEPAVNAAAVVASGIARRFDYRKVTFSVSRDLDPATDNVVVGKLPYVTRFLSTYGIALTPGKGGYLKVLQMPGSAGRPDASRALLVVSGESDAAVKIAAVTFSSMSFAFPGTSSLSAFKFDLPDLQQYSGREVLSADRLYSLKTLNFPTHSFRGLGGGARRINFRLPVDFHIRPNQYAHLTLNFSYGAGLKGDSALNILVNGESVRAIPLAERAGALVNGFRIDIPTYLFKSGANTIDFSPALHLVGQICDLTQPDNLFLTVYENSTLDFPAMPHLLEMPRLDLFAYNGFPVTRWPDGHEATLLLTEQDDRVLSAALNVLGMMTQKNGFPLFGLQVSYAPRAQGEVLVIGPLAKLPEALRKAAPLSEDGLTSIVPYPVIRSWAQEVSIAYSTQTGGSLGPGRALLMQFESPFESGRTVTVLTASDDKDLLGASLELLRPAVQGQARGNLTLIELASPEAKVTALDTGRYYMTGKDGTATLIESLLFTRPYLHYAVLVVTLMLLSLVVFLLMRRRRAGKDPT
jgi:hypothetical protein